MQFETAQLVFAVVFILFLVLIVTRILVKPLRLLAKLLFNSIVGLLMLLGFNLIGNLFGMMIPVNLVTILLTGFLGVPGLILLIILQILGF